MPDPLEIVVIASRIPNAIQFPSLPDYSEYYRNLPPDQQDPEWKFGPYTDLIRDLTNPNDLKRQMIDAIISDYYDKLTSVINFLQSKVNERYISIGMIRYISGQELLDKAIGMRTYVTGRTYSPGYAGANFGDRFEIDYRQLGRYLQFGQEGINYLILHEIAHNTVSGIETRSWMLNSYRDEVNAGTMAGNSYVGSNPYFVRQEAYTNSIAREMAQSIGLSITPSNSDPTTWPPNGYEATFQ